MQISHRVVPKMRLTVLVAFGAMCALIFGYLWVNSGGRIAGVSKDGYLVSVRIPHVANLVYDSDVMIAGVKVGKVSDLKVDGNEADVTMRFTKAGPLHKGATVQVRQKTLVDETYLEVTDGKGVALPNRSALAAGAGRSGTTLNDVLVSLDRPAREALGGVVNGLGATTAGTRTSISQALTGLGEFGRQGSDVIAALSAQSSDLRQLTKNSAALLAALNTRQGEIAQVVAQADALTKATSDNSGEIVDAMRSLPSLVESAQRAGDSLGSLGSSLQPVAADLRAAAPDLTSALNALPGTTRNLRALLPSLNSVLDSAPRTLDLVPATAGAVRNIIPDLKIDLGDVNPMLAYLKPYGRDIAAFLVNFGNTLSDGDASGHILRAFVVANEQSFRNMPVTTNGVLNKLNPYPQGSLDRPGTWSGTYPRIEADPIK